MFSEGGPRILVSISPNMIDLWKESLQKINSSSTQSVSANFLGIVKDNSELVIKQQDQEIIKLSLSKMREVFSQAIPRRIFNTQP